MKQKNTIEILNKRYRNLHHHYRDLLEDFGEEAIHDFRLEVKKLRAFLRLQRTGLREEKGFHLGKQLRLFYRAVGEVRTFQLQKNCVLQYSKKQQSKMPARYLAFLQEHEEAAKQRVRNAALLFSMPHYWQHLLKTAGKEINPGIPQKFAEQKMQDLQRCLSVPVLLDEDIHRVRKVLKDLLYVWPWISPFLATMFPGEIITKETCEALTRQLGEFQDMCTALPLLTPVIITSIPDAKEQEVLKTIAVQCENRKQVLREEIVSILINLQQNMKWKDTFRQGQQQVAFSLS